MSTLRSSQSLSPPLPRERSLNVNEISKRLSMLENRWNGITDDEDDEDDNDDTKSEATITTSTTSGDGMDTPRASESQDDDDDNDEMVHKVIANLQAKIEAVKRHKKVAAEVAALRKLLAEKERDLVECERVMALEMGQVEK